MRTRRSGTWTTTSRPTSDNGGVHLNSGIPNKAFQLAAVAVGGGAIEGAGRIWYDALVGGEVSSSADFAAFAAATVAAAGEHADAVRDAWSQVGVEPSTATGTPLPEAAPARRLRIERSGGFVGRTESAEVDLDDDLRSLAEEAVVQPVTKNPPPMPDMFQYTFTVEGRDPVTVPEHLLSTSQAELARRILRPGPAEA